jgi:hypothetical protein
MDIADAMATTERKNVAEENLAPMTLIDRIHHLAQEWEQNKPKTD